MSWNSVAFEQLRGEVRASLAGGRRTAGVPFFVFVYDPTEEVRCLRAFEQWAAALEGEGAQVQVVYLGQLLATVLENETLYLTEGGRKAEERSPDELRRELARPEGLPTLVTRALLDGRSAVCPALRGGAQDECVLLLRAGALYPFVHVSQILDALENQTGRTIVVPFPGSCHPHRRDTLQFLNETEGTYYRARIVGC